MYLDRFATVDFTQLSQISLRDFLDAYFPEARRIRSGLITPGLSLTANHYLLMFEALRMIPDIKNKVKCHEDKGMAAWTSIIAAARKNKEIKTVFTDEQIARLFIDTGHGVVINLIMTDNTTALEKEVSAQWNNLYLLITT
jgi:TetR/AcrR family transcriptional repressor of nem operon